MKSFRYLIVQILLDLLFCVFAGLFYVLYGVLWYGEFDFAIMYAAPIGYMIPVMVRYATLLEVVPRILLYHLLCADRQFRIWMALVVGLASYVWVIFALQVIYNWDQGSWFFPFYDVEGMSIYVAAMVLSTLTSPSAINFLGRQKANKVKNVP